MNGGESRPGEEPAVEDPSIQARAARRYQELLALLRGTERVAVAFSGGVDSSLLLLAALEALGRERVLALTGRSSLACAREQRAAEEIARLLGARRLVLDWDPLAIAAVRENHPGRCYHCKRAILSLARERAGEEGFPVLVEGSNRDDRDDDRPGARAVRELGVRSPLREAGLGKDEIRLLAREHGLPNGDAPALACLASRVPFGTELRPGRLARIDAAEERIRALGFDQVRVRDFPDRAMVEVTGPDLARLDDAAVRGQVARILAELGFTAWAVDPAGYRQGSLGGPETRPAQGAEGRREPRAKRAEGRGKPWDSGGRP